MSERFEGLTRELIALRVSREIDEGMYVNLGIGIPTLIGNWIEGRDIVLQSEIGMLKTGCLADESNMDQDLINASCQPVTEVPGTIYFDICDSFAMIRGGHIDLTVMGAYQVAANGDLASWNNPKRGLGFVGNIGGSMDLAAGARKLFVAMEHTTVTGEPKILETLTFPATAQGKVDMIFTDLAVIEVSQSGLVLREVAPGLSAEDVQSVTQPDLILPADVKMIEF